ncbi:MAG: hypothetical protein U5R30_06800 [Deltaproteobacteria bacterium]|nr:hypothetical protein [Deltaproteobacteria bacterium]
MMTGRLCQLLVAALGIKGYGIFALNHATEELEISKFSHRNRVRCIGVQKVALLPRAPLAVF